MVTKQHFHAAFTVGDLAAIAAYVASDAGRAEIDATERYLSRGDDDGARSVDVFPERALAFRPWYFPRRTARSGHTFLLSVAIWRGCDEIIEWLYHGEPVTFMRGTLARLLPKTCIAAICAGNVHALEMLLASRVFLEMLAGGDKGCQTQQQKLLGSLLASRHTTVQTPIIELLLAHGATDYPTAGLLNPFTRCACTGDLDQVEIFLRNGAFVVGLPTLQQPVYMGQVAVVRRLVECRADVSYGRSLHAAARLVQYRQAAAGSGLCRRGCPRRMGANATGCLDSELRFWKTEPAPAANQTAISDVRRAHKRPRQT